MLGGIASRLERFQNYLEAIIRDPSQIVCTEPQKFPRISHRVASFAGQNARVGIFTFNRQIQFYSLYENACNEEFLQALGIDTSKLLWDGIVKRIRFRLELFQGKLRVFFLCFLEKIS